MTDSFVVHLKLSHYLSIGYSCSVAQSCPTLCEPMGCSTPGFPVLHNLPELAQTHVHWVGDAIQPSHLLLPLSSQSFLTSGSFPMSWFLALRGPNIGASASASVLLMNIQGWFCLGLTSLIFHTQSFIHSFHTELIGQCFLLDISLYDCFRF